ncbi:unnamed protein product [Arctogadus glacialis]
MMLRLQCYNLDVIYKRGRELYVADALSRAHLPSTDQAEEVEEYEVMVVDVLSSHRVEELKPRKEVWLSQELDLRVFDSWQDEVRSVLNGGTTEVRELHALDWTSGLLGGSLELELPARRTGQQISRVSALPLRVELVVELIAPRTPIRAGHNCEVGVVKWQVAKQCPGKMCSSRKILWSLLLLSVVEVGLGVASIVLGAVGISWIRDEHKSQQGDASPVWSGLCVRYLGDNMLS